MSARRYARHGERGQVLPLWIFGGITTLALMFLAINYANAVRYQIRAQNAADSAATALIAIQSQRFNLMNIALYNANVEEYRLRRTLDGMMLASSFSGGCNPNVVTSELPGAIDIITGSSPAGACDQIYQNLRYFYMKSTNRYSADVVALNNITSDIGFAGHFKPDAMDMINQLGKGSPQCIGTPNATQATTYGDCLFTYRFSGSTNLGITKRTGLLAVEQNANQLLVPGLGYTSTNYSADSENSDLFAPAEVDVTTCYQVPPIIPNFGPIHLPPSYAIGRAAATDVMVEEDWLDPGRIADPVRAGSELFQAPEFYTLTSAQASQNASATDDWYNTNFGGNDAYAYPQFGFFSSNLGSDELSARVGWWNAIPIRPFVTSAVTIASACN